MKPRLILVLFMAAILAACASAPYTKAINDFKAASDDAQKAVVALADKVTAAEQEKRDALVLNAVNQVTRKDARQCASGAPGCEIVIKTRVDNEVKDLPVTVPPALPNLREFAAQMNLYAGHLQAIATADATAEINGSLAAVEGTAGKVAKALEVETPPAVSLVSGAVSLLGGLYFDSVKIRALREATAAGQAALGPFEEHFSVKVAEWVDVIRNASSAEEFEKARTAFENARRERPVNPKKVADTYMAFRTAARALDSELKMSPGDALRALWKAHAALHKAMRDPELHLKAAIEAVNEYKDKVKALFEAAREQGLLA